MANLNLAMLWRKIMRTKAIKELYKVGGLIMMKMITLSLTLCK